MPTITSHDKWPADRWQAGEHFAFAADFNKEGLTRDQIKLSVEIGDRAPDGTVITCVTPDTPSKKGPRGYASIRHGNVNDDTSSVKGVPPRKIGDLQKLEDDFIFAFDRLGDGDSNILFDAFFLRDPAKHGSRVLELGVIPRPSTDALAFAKTGKSLGIFTDRFGIAWLMPRFDSGYVMPIPVNGPVLSGVIDRLDMLRWLIGKGVGDRDLWFTGTALGLEPTAGTTRLTIKRWSPILR